MLTKPTEGGVVDIAVIRDVALNPDISLGNEVLAKPDELHVVILKPLWIPFPERLAIDEVVVPN